MNAINVSKAVKTSEGVVQFNGELSQQEFDFVMEVGLNTLFEAGALPFKAIDDGKDLMSILKGTGGTQ